MLSTKSYEKTTNCKEIEEVIKSLNANSAEGPDGITTKIFQRYWKIIGEDVIQAVWGFLKGTNCPKVFMATTIVPVPKISNLQTWEDYRPIALSNVFSRIISKVLYGYLKD